jgi:hypothetical protein
VVQRLSQPFTDLICVGKKESCVASLGTVGKYEDNFLKEVSFSNFPESSGLTIPVYAQISRMTSLHNSCVIG